MRRNLSIGALGGVRKRNTSIKTESKTGGKGGKGAYNPY